MTQRGKTAIRFGVAVGLILVAPAMTGAAEPVAAEPAARQWLEEVEALITEEEREAFLGLEHEYQRRRFIDRFWETRDPFPDTRVNEFFEEWGRRQEIARERYGGAATDRGRALMLAGPPKVIHPQLCPSLLSANEVWVYRGEAGRDRVLIFRLRPAKDDPYRLWRPQEGLPALVDWASAPASAIGESDLRRRIARECGRARETVALLANAVDLEMLLEETGRLPRPSPEWVGTFLRRGTDVPAGAPTLAGRLEIAYPGAYKSRTIVQGLIVVPAGAAAASRPARGPAAYHLRVNGEVLRGDELFEHFRYRFDLPVADLRGGDVPLLIRRHLRPGRYEIVLRVEDLNAGSFFRTRRELEVPRRTTPAVVATAADPEPAEPTAEAPAPQGGRGEPRVVAAIARPQPATELDLPLAALARELLAADPGEVAEPEHIVKILPLPDHLMTGRQRVDTSVSGPGIAKVAFFLDGRKVMAKSRAPFSLELDFGRAPRTRMLEAVAYDAEGGELARDRVPVNAGPQRFAVRLLEPRSGERYHGSLQAHAEVDLARGENLERVELYLNERKLATLFQPPFVQPVLLPRDEAITYVRAVAVLADGHSAEDLVVINGPPNLDALQVDFVELYTSVLDRKGNNIEGLAEGDFQVFENEVEQQIRRFERVVDLPINATVVIDASLSMQEEMKEAEEAALAFFQRVIEPKDRAGVIVFNDRPDLRVPLTSNHEVLAGGLSAVEADGETALYDSVIFGLYYLAGLRGKRALIVLSDGEDSVSKYTFDEALEFARHSGTAIYTIGLGLPTREQMAQARLRKLASETGGAHYSVNGAKELNRVYEQIEAELRAQYLIAYQSSWSGDEGFREVEVAVGRSGLEVKTIPGYFP